jgi:hypothetical protein
LGFCFPSGAGFGVLLPGFFQDLFQVFLAFFALAEVLGDGDGALLGVFEELFHGVGWVWLLLLLAEVAAGDLEAVEQEPGAFGIDLIGCETDEDLGDGGLDGAPVFRVGEDEGGFAAFARLLFLFGNRLS